MYKKVFTLCLSALVSSVAVEAQNAYFQTGFDEGMPQSFTLHDVDGRTPSIDMANLGFEVGKAWIVNSGVDPDDPTNKVAISTSWYKDAGSANDWMVTGSINVDNTKAVVRFRTMARDKDFADGYKVYVSETGTDVADFTSAPILNVSKEVNKWTEHEISLADFVGKTIYIAFVNDSKDKAALYLDDLFIGVPSHVSMALDLGRVYDGYGNIPISGTVSAVNEDVNGYTVGISSGDMHYEQKFDEVVKAGNSVSFTLDNTFSIERNNTSEWIAWIKSGSDSMSYNGKTSAYLWKIVAEEVTGTWCGYCVRGIGAMNYMSQTYPDGFIGIAVHNNGSANVPDSMAIPGEEYLNAIFNNMGSSGYPHAGVNRNAMYWIDPADIPTTYTYIKNKGTNSIGIAMNAQYNNETNKIETNADFYFAANSDKANYRIAYVVVENDVHRTHAETGILNSYCGYDQINYYAGGSMGEMYGFENKPGIINADDIWYQDVARGIYPDYAGIENALSINSVSDGDHFNYSYSFEMPATVLNKENAQVVLLLMNADKVILNAERCKIEGTATAIDSIKANGANSNDNNYYNLNGVKVENPNRGIYIHNGKKIVL